MALVRCDLELSTHNLLVLLVVRNVVVNKTVGLHGQDVGGLHQCIGKTMVRRALPQTEEGNQGWGKSRNACGVHEISDGEEHGNT